MRYVNENCRKTVYFYPGKQKKCDEQRYFNNGSVLSVESVNCHRMGYANTLMGRIVEVFRHIILLQVLLPGLLGFQAWNLLMILYKRLFAECFHL